MAILRFVLGLFCKLWYLLFKVGTILIRSNENNTSWGIKLSGNNGPTQLISLGVPRSSSTSDPCLYGRYMHERLELVFFLLLSLFRVVLGFENLNFIAINLLFLVKVFQNWETCNKQQRCPTSLDVMCLFLIFESLFLT